MYESGYKQEGGTKPPSCKRKSIYSHQSPSGFGGLGSSSWALTGVAKSITELTTVSPSKNAKSKFFHISSSFLGFESEVPRLLTKRLLKRYTACSADYKATRMKLGTKLIVSLVVIILVEHTIERAVLLGKEASIGLKDLPLQ